MWCRKRWKATFKGVMRLDDPARFRAWIYAIAARKCTDAPRGKYRALRVAEAANAQAMLADHDGDREAAAGMELDLAAALKRLPPEQRVAVSLFFGEDLSVAEIAAITGVPPGTVKSRLFAARQALRASMEREVK